MKHLEVIGCDPLKFRVSHSEHDTAATFFILPENAVIDAQHFQDIDGAYRYLFHVDIIRSRTSQKEQHFGAGFLHLFRKVRNQIFLLGPPCPFGPACSGLLPRVIIGFNALYEGFLRLKRPITGLNNEAANIFPEIHRIDICGADHMTLTTGGAFVEILREIPNILVRYLPVAEQGRKEFFEGAGRFVALDDLPYYSMLRTQDPKKIHHLGSRDDRFFFVLVIYGAPGETLPAPGAGVQFNQSFYVQVGDEEIRGLGRPGLGFRE